MLKIKICLIIMFLLFNNNLLLAMETCEVNTNPVLSSKLVYDKTSSDMLRNLSNEYLKIYNKQSFDKNFYQKINSFIDSNKHSYSSLSALLMLTSMCFLENDEALYSEYGKKIIEYILAKYPTTVQGKIVLLLKAQVQSEEGFRKEALKLLQDNYEVILSVEKDETYKNYTYELNFENHDPITAEYLFLLANISFFLNKDDEAIKGFNMLIKLYPNSDAAGNAKRALKAIEALNKSL